MAAVVRFAQPVPDLVLKRALNATEETAFAAGLKSRHSTRGLEFSVSAGGIQAASREDGVRGLMFNATFDDDPSNTLRGTRLAEQIQLDIGQLIYRTWRYVSWTWQLQRMQSLMRPALDVLSGIVSISQTRLEYLDRFMFEGDLAAADVKSLLKFDSEHIAKHVFDATDLWHSYTGAFVPGAVKRLEVVNLDALDLPGIEDSESTRWVHMTTAYEDRYNPLAEIPVDQVFKSFDGMHFDLKQLLGSLITDAMAKRIYLKD